ncbi:prepilin-type N-terminal cleavage/methylation domain-containing protein [Sutcliffiella horikoshii]|uniref:competence type IV pilus minor pilin ComGF n=1 Tax=Sutcliffiella horikoshii TaxID=79883 RepID=UPI00384F7676
MSIIRKEEGFTLLEVLISFSLVLVLTTFFPLLIKNLITLTEINNGINQMELEVFIQQANREIKIAKRVFVEGKVLVIINQADQRVTYEYYQQKIRRRVNGSGHELLLHHVKSINFVEQENGASFRLEGSDDVVYEFRISAIPNSWYAE